MEKLRTNDYLVNIKEIEGVALSADLQCSCSSRDFHIYFQGKQTKGVLAPFLIRKNKYLCVKAVCAKCGNNIVIYNSATDGYKPKDVKTDSDFEKLTLSKSKNDKWNIILKYNYFPDTLKEKDVYTNDFVNCFVYIIDDNKEKALLEEENR